MRYSRALQVFQHLDGSTNDFVQLAHNFTMSSGTRRSELHKFPRLRVREAEFIGVQ